MSRRSLVAIALLIAGCTYWEPYPRDAIAPGGRLPYSLRVTSLTGRVQLVDPYLRSDTLFGRTRGDTVGIPLGELRSIERHRVDGGRTIGLILLSAGSWLTLGILTVR